ncbi:HEPN domain-containing protein [Streptomyces sp. WAC07149]|uniref:HEPN domain-containing protein n=1 Tax=Streptomyces sp. WAC07149 TaxID=2487425 RepID=UPI00163D2703|nr:HEPN domain-containing protein [Streptomyces sp. WAC07149]
MYEDPRTPQDWEDVALERRSDAVHLHSADRQVACLYYLGFTAECFAKALCVAQGRPVPRGRDGHDVLTILAQAGYSPNVLPPEVRNFLSDRDVSLRYQAVLPEDVRIEDEIKAANRFVSWCIKQLRRRTRAQRRKTP